jgi:hypothetical protein
MLPQMTTLQAKLANPGGMARCLVRRSYLGVYRFVTPAEV